MNRDFMIFFSYVHGMLKAAKVFSNIEYPGAWRYQCNLCPRQSRINALCFDETWVTWFLFAGGHFWQFFQVLEMKSMSFFTTVVFHLSFTPRISFWCILEPDWNWSRLLWCQAVSNYPLSRVIWWLLHLPHFLFQKNLERKFPFHCRTWVWPSATIPILSWVRPLVPQNKCLNLQWWKIEGRGSSGRAEHNLNMARPGLFSPFALRPRYDTPNNFIQVDGGRFLLGKNGDRKRIFCFWSNQSSEFWWVSIWWSFFREVNNFVRNLATVAHVRCLGGPMGGHIHSGLRMAMSGDRNSFTMSLRVWYIWYICHICHLCNIIQCSPVLDCEFWKDLTGATSFKDLFTQKWQAAIAWYERNIWSSRLQLSK